MLSEFKRTVEFWLNLHNSINSAACDRLMQIQADLEEIESEFNPN